MESVTWCAPIESVHVTDGQFDLIVTDPPYAKRVDSGVRSGKKTKSSISERKMLGFAPSDLERITRWSAWIATAVKRWACVFSDHESSMTWAEQLERAGLTYVRCLPWIRTGDELTAEKPRKSGAPQFTGDRPATGHEIIVLCHKGGNMRWNGRGRSAVYTAPIVPPSQRVHPTQKPISLMRDIISDFALPGESICDPFCGSGTTLVAARQLRMAPRGGDMDKRWADYTNRRVFEAGLLIKEN